MSYSWRSQERSSEIRRTREGDTPAQIRLLFQLEYVVIASSSQGQLAIRHRHGARILLEWRGTRRTRLFGFASSPSFHFSGPSPASHPRLHFMNTPAIFCPPCAEHQPRRRRHQSQRWPQITAAVHALSADSAAIVHSHTTRPDHTHTQTASYLSLASLQASKHPRDACVQAQPTTPRAANQSQGPLSRPRLRRSSSSSPSRLAALPTVVHGAG